MQLSYIKTIPLMICIENISLNLSNSVAPHYSTQDPGGGVGSTFKGWRWVGLGVGLGIRGRRCVGICQVGGVGFGSNSTPWILCSAVRTRSSNSAEVFQI